MQRGNWGRRRIEALWAQKSVTKNWGKVRKSKKGWHKSNVCIDSDRMEKQHHGWLSTPGGKKGAKNRLRPKSHKIIGEDNLGGIGVLCVCALCVCVLPWPIAETGGLEYPAHDELQAWTHTQYRLGPNMPECIIYILVTKGVCGCISDTLKDTYSRRTPSPPYPPTKTKALWTYKSNSHQ